MLALKMADSLHKHYLNLAPNTTQGKDLQFSELFVAVNNTPIVYSTPEVFFKIV